ncbi:3-oxoacyl-[acyl-carrier-protein] synthase-1 [Natronospira proteinivora]|uniref:3-oxoacyl-[acyl-carrier-protein] synthase-1 n=1 Tax=Natronospira proteinivora TaxID=1807133 RepID=A0ABT1G9Z8_9GAMM|nr:beta-ketoacyl synthase N-terminal-like domain-containing protein [Natronospira proteinivora]MCP1727735.1 3-oxoacyl-[acyl-carrier-protein] synthase-1 [Natronospira proteinivora]
MPKPIHPVHIVGHAMACPHNDPAAAFQAGAPPTWTPLPVPGYPGVERPYGFLHQREAPEQALDRLLDEALSRAGLSAAERVQAPVLMGTSSLNIGENEKRIIEQLHQSDSSPALEDARWGFMLDQYCQRHGLEGPQTTFNTACSSSANALLYAQRILSLDLAPAVVVIGFEAYNGISFGGFHGLMLLSPQDYRPFDPSRQGIILGEGVAVAVLRRDDKGAVARLEGGDTAIDFTGITVASEDSLARVMRSALDKTGNTPVQAIKAHGTGTAGNDQAEANAIHQVFGEQAPPYFSLKGGLGHSLGACGLVELLSLSVCRDRGFLPASLGYGDHPPQTQETAEEEEIESLPLLPLDTQQAWPEPGRLLLNYFGFGGNNTSLVVTL